MNAPVWFVGAGGHAKVAVAVLQSSGGTVGGIFDQRPSDAARQILGHAVTCPAPGNEWFADCTAAHIAIGDNRARQRIAQELDACPHWATIIHPTAVIHPSADIGPGVLVCANAVIQPDARIGRHTIVNTGCIVEHDCIVGEFCHLAPRSCLAGDVRVGAGVFLGAGAVVIPGLSVAAWSVVGAGAVVVRNVLERSTVVGVPGREIRSAPFEESESLSTGSRNPAAHD